MAVLPWPFSLHKTQLDPHSPFSKDTQKISNMDLFQKPPFYVLLDITKSVVDLPSLFHLVQASPTVSSLFHDCAPEIFHAVIQNSVPPTIQGLLYSIAHIRSGKTASHGLVDFMSKIGSYHADEGSRTPSPAVFREILMLACKIQHLGYQCIHEMLHKCHTMNVSHMANPDTEYSSPNPRMQRYQPQDSGPPTWAEEQRVYRALWRLQLFFDLQQAAAHDLQQCTSAVPSLNWPRRDLQRLLNLTPEQFWDPMEHTLLEELRTVKQCIGNMYQDWSMLQLPKYRGKICYNWPILPPFVPKQGRKIFVGPEAHLKYLNHPAAGYFVIKYLSEDYASPVQFVGFAPFRRYGLAIWDRKRTMALELTGIFLNERDYPDGDYPGIYMSGFNQYFTLRSMMTEEDLQRWAEKRRQVLEGNISYSIYSEL